MGSRYIKARINRGFGGEGHEGHEGEPEVTEREAQSESSGG